MSRNLAAALGLLLCLVHTPAKAEGTGFNPDDDPDRLRWSEIGQTLGPAPAVGGRSYGVVVKTPVNEYWRLMTAGYRARAAADGVVIDVQSAKSETDIERQLAIMHNMLGNRYDAIMISPISAQNLQPAVDDALGAGIPLIDVDGASVENVPHFVGPVNIEMGHRAAQWFIDNVPSGGSLAVIQGQAGVLSTVQRSEGFQEAAEKTGKFKVVARVAGDWDPDKAHAAAETILREHPDVVGIYCNNDTMALAAIEAVKKAGALGKVRVIGSDGTRAAYASIRKGELTGTVDIFPWMIGWIGLEIGERVSVGQDVARVIETPQALVTRDNLNVFDVDPSALEPVLRGLN